MVVIVSELGPPDWAPAIAAVAVWVTGQSRKSDPKEIFTLKIRDPQMREVSFDHSCTPGGAVTSTCPSVVVADLTVESGLLTTTAGVGNCNIINSSSSSRNERWQSL